MASNPASSSSSSASTPSFSPKKHDVFISFRGEDTRTNFTSHLHDAFCRKKIQAYTDQRLHKGDDISSSLLQAIEDSYVSVLVFSRNYASSRWCLDELTHILHCKRNYDQIVVPVFYEVDPSHVRHFKGTYEQALKEHEKDLKHQHKVPKWKVALNEAANLVGWDSQTFRNASELIHKIVEDVMRKLAHRYPPTELKGLVGIDNNLAYVESLFKKFQTIGIWGMGGIGKTTIAKILYSKYASHYEASCFLENVREFQGKHGNGLYSLRHRLFSELLDEEENINHIGTSITKSNFVKYRLKRMKVLIVLDDISSLEQLEYLTLDGENHCFGMGSTIIITTRDKHVLSKGVDRIYEVNKLEFKESLELFNLNAFFNENLPSIGYKELSMRAIVYAKGIPLALKVLGSYLRGKSEIEWSSAMDKVEKIPHEDIQKVLRLSYDGLNNEEKKAFLDIACFLKGGFKDDVMKLLDGFGFYGGIGIKALQDKALITIDQKDFIGMHDLIQEMGREIVREESIIESGKRSRLWDFEEVYDMLANNKGSDKVEGIILNLCGIKAIYLSEDTFKKMSNLRFLKLYIPENMYWRSRNVHLPKGLKFLPNKIRYLEWSKFPLKSLPSSFCPEKLVELNMINSKLKRLWNGVQDLGNLKKIVLVQSRHLIELPDFSKAFSLETIDLSGCESLLSVHPSILSLQSLQYLDLSRCRKVKSLTSEIHFRSLEYLAVNHCVNLKEFSVSSEKLRKLNFFRTRIKTLDSSLGFSSNLEKLYLYGPKLENLPDELSWLRALNDLHLSHVKVVDHSKLQILLDAFRSLSRLSLYKCNKITEIPKNIQNLSMLVWLEIEFCKGLRSLPDLPRSISSLVVVGCTSLDTISVPIISKETTSISSCPKLNAHSIQSIVEEARSVMIGSAYEFQDRLIRFPGRRVPEWFRFRTTQSSMTIEFPTDSCLVGFVFCFVARFPSSAIKYYQSYIARCECSFGDLSLQSFSQIHQTMNSDHICMWSDKKVWELMLELIEVRRERGIDPFISNNLNLCFEFSVEIGGKGKGGIPIKECGVCPLYVSD